MFKSSSSAVPMDQTENKPPPVVQPATRQPLAPFAQHHFECDEPSNSFGKIGKVCIDFFMMPWSFLCRFTNAA
jgi:hypothetical protein